MKLIEFGNKFYILGFALLLLFGCESNGKKVLPSSVGKMNDMVLVINDDILNSNVGKTITKLLLDPVDGLPQEEPWFSISQANFRNFSKLHKASRNIVIVQKGEKDTIEIGRNVWASPQFVIKIIGTTNEKLSQSIKNNSTSIRRDIKNYDINHFKKLVTKNSYPQKTFDSLDLGFKVSIPSDFRIVSSKKSFMWFRKDFPNGSSNINIYSHPIEEDSNIQNEIIRIRDLYGEKYVNGQFDNTYLKTDLGYLPYMEWINIDGKDLLEVKGVWEIANDFMAGPFISYSYVDFEKMKVYIIDGFLYLPNKKKRNSMFELEIILKSINFD